VKAKTIPDSMLSPETSARRSKKSPSAGGFGQIRLRGGGIAEAEPGQDEDADEKWLPKAEISDPNVNWNGLHLYLTVTEEVVWCIHRPTALESMRYLFDLPIECPPVEE
jgi:hypothetical protein